VARGRLASRPLESTELDVHVERPTLLPVDRRPDLPLNERLADAFARRLGGVGSFGIAMRHDPRLAQPRSRQAS